MIYDVIVQYLERITNNQVVVYHIMTYEYANLITLKLL